MKTINDVRRDRAAWVAKMEARDAREAKKHRAETPRHPAIGVLCRNGRPMYYAYVGGGYVESRDLASVESAVAEGGAE